MAPPLSGRKIDLELSLEVRVCASVVLVGLVPASDSEAWGGAGRGAWHPRPLPERAAPPEEGGTMQWEGEGRRHRGCVPWSERGSFPTGPGVAMLGGLGGTWHLSVQVGGAAFLSL